MCTRYLITNRVSELKVHIELTRFVQPEKIEIDANERAVNEKSPYCFFVCTTFDSFLNDLFSYADKFFKDQSIRVGVINNIWLFIPFGTGLYRNIQKKWVLLIPFLLSVAIETIQYIMGLGIAEFDDIFGNTVGGWVGIAVAYMMIKWKITRQI